MNQFNDSEYLEINQVSEIDRLRSYCDFTIPDLEKSDNYIQVGTLEEIETFHMFLMRDLYRDERPINFEMAYTQGREIDKKYYFIPLKRTQEGSIVRYKIDRALMKYVVEIHKKGYRSL